MHFSRADVQLNTLTAPGTKVLFNLQTEGNKSIKVARRTKLAEFPETSTCTVISAFLLLFLQHTRQPTAQEVRDRITPQNPRAKVSQLQTIS